MIPPFPPSWDEPIKQNPRFGEARSKKAKRKQEEAYAGRETNRLAEGNPSQVSVAGP